MVIKRFIPSFVFILIGVVAYSCTGLDPEEIRRVSTISGLVRIVQGASDWPTDSIYDLRVVAFEVQPSVPEEIIASLVGQTAVYTSSSLPLRFDTVAYTIDVIATPRTFTYVVVAMQNGPNFLKDWIMLSIYAPSGDPTQPGQVLIPSMGNTTVDFLVDFANLPPQPF